MIEKAPSREDVLAALMARFEEPELAQTWYETKPIPGFSSLTAAQLVDDGRGADVFEYIAAVDAGIYA